MNIALLHGAAVNAGDFLILERTKALLTHYYPDCVINEFFRNSNLEEYIPSINQNDIVIFAGGPGYYNSLAQVIEPFIVRLSEVKIPIMILGMGWFGSDCNPYSVYNYAFNENMINFLKRVVHDTHILSCRDFLSMNVLRNNGFDNSLMTGCPAWYDLENINNISYQKKPLTNIRKICISDHAVSGNINSAINLTTFIRKFFNDAEIIYVFHRGVSSNSEFIAHLSSLNIQYTDISNSCVGFHLYDDCDLHIGFRVHAHIYNLSKRNLSILITEDARGSGVNAALGLPDICACLSILKSDNSSMYIQNDLLIYQVEDYIFNLAANNYSMINGAYSLMNSYFKEMERHILSIRQFI